MALNDSAAADILNKFSEMVQSYYEQLNTQKQLSLNEVNQLYSKLKNLEKVTVWEDEQENCIISDILMYIEIILTFVSNTSAFEFRQLKSFINIYLGALLEVLATASFRNKFIINCTDKVFNMFLYYKFNFVAVEGLLALFNEIASTVRLEVRKETGESLIHYVYQLIDTLILFGDYVIQSHVIETIFHIFGSFIMQSDLSYPLFPNDAELDASLKEVNCPKLYDEKVRLWLNKFNMRNPKILSLACQTILIGDYYCLPPKGFDTLWVDFNIEDKTVAFYCNSANDTVNRVYIVSKNVKNIHINRQLGKKEAILRLKLSKACITNVDQNIWDSMPKNIKIIIQNQEKEISNLIRTILPRLFKDVFSHVSPKISRSLKEVYKPLRIKQYRVSTVNHKSTGKSTGSNKKVSNNDADLNSSTEVHIPESQSSLKFSKPTDYITSPVSIEAHVAESQMNVKISKSRSDLVTSPISTFEHVARGRYTVAMEQNKTWVQIITEVKKHDKNLFSITELISESSTTRSVPDNRSDILSDNDEPTTTKDVIQDRSVSSSFKFVESSEEFQTAKDVCSLEFEETDGIVRRVQLTTSKLCSNVQDELTCNKSKPFSTNCSRRSVWSFKEIHNINESNADLLQPQDTVPLHSSDLFEDPLIESHQNNPVKYSICPFENVHETNVLNVVLPQSQNTLLSQAHHSSTDVFEDALTETDENYHKSSICPFKDVVPNNKEPNIALPQPQDMGLSPQAIYSSPDLFEDALSEPYQNNNKSSICPFKDILHNNKEPNVELPQPQGTVPAPRVAYSSLGAFEDAVSETYQNNPKRSICPFKDILHNIKEPNVALPQPQNTVPAPRDLYSSPGTFEDASPETYQNNLKSSICPFKDILHNNKEPNVALPQPQDTVLAPQVLSSSPGTFEDASPETYQNNLKSSICPFKDILHNNKEPNVALPQPQDTVLAPQVLSSSPGTFEDALPETYQNNLKSSICPFKDVLHNNKEPNIALPQPQDTVLAPQVLYSSPGTFEDALPETYQNNLKSSICLFKDFVNNNKDILHNNKEPNVVLPQADDSVLPPQVLCSSPHVFEDTLPDKYQNKSSICHLKDIPINKGPTLPQPQDTLLPPQSFHSPQDALKDTHPNENKKIPNQNNPTPTEYNKEVVQGVSSLDDSEATTALETVPNNIETNQLNTVQVDVHIVDNGSVTPEKKVSSESGQSSSLLEFLEQEDLKQQGKLKLLTNHSVTVTPENKVSSESGQSSSLLEFVNEQEDLEQGELKLLTNNNVTVTPEKKVSSDSGQSSSLLEFVQEQEDLEQPGNSNLLTSHSVTVTPEKKLMSEHGQSFSLLEFIEQENFKTPRKSKLLANQKIEKCFKNVKRRSKTLQKPKSSGDCNETESHGLNVINSESAAKGNATKNHLAEPTDECLEKRLQTSNNDPSRNNIEHVAVNISLESDIASVCYNPLNTNSVNQDSNRQLINSGAARKYASTPRKETRPKESTLCSINISNIAADFVLIRNETQKYFPDRNNVIHSEDSTVSAGNTQTDFNLTDSDKTLIVGTDSTGDCVVGPEEKKNASKGRKQQNKQKKRKLPGSDQSLNVLKPVEDGVMPGDMKKRDDSQREKQHTERRRRNSAGFDESSNVFELLENDSKDVRPDENEKKHDSKRKKQTADRKKRKLGSDVGLDGKVKTIDSKRKKQPIDKKKIKSPDAHPSWNVLKLLKDDVRLGEEKRNDSQRKKQPTEREKRILSGSDQSSNQCETLDNDIVAEQNIQENSEREKTSEFQNEQSNRNFTSVGEDTDNNDSLILLEANMAEENTANLNVESCDTFTKIKNNKRNITTGKKQDEITESVMELCEDSTFKKRKNRTLFDPTDLSYLDRINLDETFMTTKTNIPNVPSSPKSKQTKNRTKATTTIKNRSIKKKTKPKKQPDTVESPYFNRRSKGHCADVSFRPRNLDWNELLNISRNLPNRNNSSGSRTEFPSLSFAHVRDDNDTCQLPMDSFTSSSLEEEEPLNTESVVNEIDISGIDKRANHTVFDHGPEEAQAEDVEITENETRFPQKTLNSKEVVKKLLQLAITCLDDDNNNNPELIAKIQALLE